MPGIICLTDETTGAAFWINLNRRLTLNQFVPQSFVCPKCQQSQEVLICEGVNVSVEQAWKAQVLKGELFKFTCRHCGRRLKITHPFLYLDTVSKLLIWMPCVEGQKPPLEEDSLALMRRCGYTFRIVKTRKEVIALIKEREPEPESHFAKWPPTLAKIVSGLIPYGFETCRQYWRRRFWPQRL